jgi:hypothetical protein
MMAAPRCCTVVMNSPSNHASSSTAALMGFPATVPWLTSGYWVLEWLPQMMTFLTSLTFAPVFRATCTGCRLVTVSTEWPCAPVGWAKGAMRPDKGGLIRRLCATGRGEWHGGQVSVLGEVLLQGVAG